MSTAYPAVKDVLGDGGAEDGDRRSIPLTHRVRSCIAANFLSRQPGFIRLADLTLGLFLAAGLVSGARSRVLLYVRRVIRRFASWVGSNPATALTILGIISYFAVTYSYRSFYGELGVDPEDVGIGYRRTLTDAAFAAVAIVATTIVFFGTWLVVGLVLAPVRYAYGRWVRGVRRPLNIRNVLFSDAGGYVASVLLVLTFFLIPDGYKSMANDVRGGEPLHWESPVDFDNPFGLSAPLATLQWISDEPRGFKPEGPLLYLGRSGGVVVIFDAGTDRVLRLPEGGVIIETSDASSLPA